MLMLMLLLLLLTPCKRYVDISFIQQFEILITICNFLFVLLLLFLLFAFLHLARLNLIDLLLERLDLLLQLLRGILHPFHARGGLRIDFRLFVLQRFGCRLRLLLQSFFGVRFGLYFLFAYLVVVVVVMLERDRERESVL